MRTVRNGRHGAKDKVVGEKLSKESVEDTKLNPTPNTFDNEEGDVKTAVKPDNIELTPPSSEGFEEEKPKESPATKKVEKEDPKKRRSRKKKAGGGADSLSRTSKKTSKKKHGPGPNSIVLPTAPAPLITPSPATNPSSSSTVVARGKHAPPHLKGRIVLNNRFLVGSMKNGGAYGQIYSATDQADNKTVAIKVEPEGPGAGRMILEQRVLKALRGTGHAPTLIGSGTHGGFMYLIMEMLGRNLTDLRKRQPKKRFSTTSTIRVALQGIQAVFNLHNIGFIHRDIKPLNMVIGLSSMQQTIVYLIDYGMTRQYRFENGVVRKERIFACFRGTLRYVSLNVHDMKEQGPVDDLISLFYTMIELGEGALPWRHATEPDLIANKKRNTPLSEFVFHLPKGVLEFARHLDGVNYPQMPDYKLIQNLLNEALGPQTEQVPFDWENQQYDGPEEPSS